MHTCTSNHGLTLGHSAGMKPLWSTCCTGGLHSMYQLHGTADVYMHQHHGLTLGHSAGMKPLWSTCCTGGLHSMYQLHGTADVYMHQHHGLTLDHSAGTKPSLSTCGTGRLHRALTSCKAEPIHAPAPRPDPWPQCRNEAIVEHMRHRRAAAKDETAGDVAACICSIMLDKLPAQVITLSCARPVAACDSAMPRWLHWGKCIECLSGDVGLACASMWLSISAASRWTSCLPRCSISPV